VTQTKKLDHVFLFLEVFAQEGGIQSYVQDLLNAYQSLDYQAELLVLRDNPQTVIPLNPDKIKFSGFRSSSTSLGRIKFSLALLNCLIVRRPHHIYCGHVKLATLTEFFSRLFNIPYTVLTYGKEVWNPLPSGEKQALQNAQQIWTISRYSGTCLSSANDINPEKIAILPCVVDSEQFTPGEKPRELLAKYQLDNARVLFTVARLWSGDIYKGVDVTIRALPQILKVFPDVKYLVVGRGDDQSRLQQLTEELGVADKVIFAGFVPNQELVAHYRVADAYIMPSQEGFGIVYLEAMCCGKPVLSGNADGSADPLQDGLLGWQVPHRDVDAVTQGCIEILQGSDLRCQGDWLREQTMAKFSLTALRQKLAELLIASSGNN
jgi:glycosyltransferase involved in cell wall biosynthesis